MSAILHNIHRVKSVSSESIELFGEHSEEPDEAILSSNTGLDKHATKS